ncbi:uncharacterized protein LOC126679145 [Mercurialis annua]|uniref:uncharacterized protein LOC126679145 n=1 Tax=Mercurialis annua TaxID=3986 RepID=UPI00215DF249|nr:uncharacterized protein LOC126679145 [Mercurialis annua]XP_050230042.1 uncharacterized protein LOC126679145 [Mercurialis annua]
MMQGDFDLFPLRRPTDSIKHVLKQTMVNQDVMFKNQVHELHRLYRVQESLMTGVDWEECDYNLWKTKLQSSLLPLTNPTVHESPAKLPRLSLNCKVSSLPFVDQDCRPLELQLSADEFINRIEEDFRRKRNARNSFSSPIDLTIPFSEGNCSDAENLKLSLTLGGDNKRMRGAIRTCFAKKNYYCSQNVIDLEEADESVSDGYPKCSTSFKLKHEMQDPASCDLIILASVKKDLSHEIVESNSSQEHSECCQEQISISEGFRVSPDDSPSDDLSSKMQHRGLLDLNKVLFDNSSCCSDDNMLTEPSRPSSEGSSDGFTGGVQDGNFPDMFKRKEDSKCLNEASEIVKQDNLALVDLNEKFTSTDIWTGDYDFICRKANLEIPESTISPLTVVSEDLGCCSGDDRNGSVAVKSKLSYIEVSRDTHEAANPKSPASCRSYRISDNDLSTARTTNCGIASATLNKDSNTRLGSQDANIPTGEHEQRNSDSSNSKNDCCNIEEEAAELLIHIYSKHSARDQDSSAKEIRNEREVKPLCSFDSFELNAINLTETNMDDNAVSSKQFEITEMEAKEFGMKLRRGRRLKDFQKEIMPNMASLSRHEIQEDINIMQGVLRSREYRKMRAKTANNCSPPLRSRRSRAARKKIA